MRECYIQLTANNRNYRDAMLTYAHALKAGIPAEAEAAEVQTAEHEPDATLRACLDDVIELLDKLVKLHAKARLAMRIDLGITRQPSL
ncbi:MULTISPECIES: hypothetical protein [Amycolatopsis]|uniref:Uncharacterized protein n=1 Tax=Amycolatopsis albidoflavus TaxID=102226 RepID=A0ABW5I5E7_9PSEU